MKTTLLCTFLCAFAAQAVSAITIDSAQYRDIDFVASGLYQGGPALSGQFDIASGSDTGDMPIGNLANYNVLSVVAGFLFVMDDPDSRTVVHSADFKIGDYFSISNVASSTKLPGSVAGFFGTLPTAAAYFQVEFDSSNYPSLSDLVADVAADGLVDWMVSLSPGSGVSPNTSSTLWAGFLGVNAEWIGGAAHTDPHGVADSGSTFGLLGLGLAGLVLLVRNSKVQA